MKTIEIKKALYKQNPIANFVKIKKERAIYITNITLEDNSDKLITFDIPVNDMGDAEFLYMMDAKYLIRWIVNITE